jgi:hypothetical protein
MVVWRSINVSDIFVGCMITNFTSDDDLVYNGGTLSEKLPVINGVGVLRDRDASFAV